MIVALDKLVLISYIVKMNQFSRVIFSPFVRTFSTKQGPLQGVKILDMTRVVAGPMCTMILAELGADVYKVEEKNYGDSTRNWGPYVKGTNLSCQYVSVNRSKKSIGINIRDKSGQEIILDMAKKCDVLVENYVPGNLDKYGLGYQDIEKVAPGIIYCSITGFGSNGPYSNKPGVDLIAASMGGLLSITGPKDGDPCRPGIAVTDMMTGLHAYGSIVSALYLKSKTGLGQKIDCDLFSTQVAALTNVGTSYLNAGVETNRLGTAHQSVIPYQAFKTKDDYVIICALNNNHLSELCSKMSLDNLAQDERFATHELRVENKKEIVNILSKEFLKKTSAEWLKLFENSSFPYAPVNKISQVFEDRHVKSIGIVKDIEHPTAGKVKIIGPAVKFSKSCNDVKSYPPLLGEHTVEVLSNLLGYSEEKIKSLRNRGVVK